ncbi:metal-dependent hydrolase [Tissierella creatinophila]|uniref:Inner membrane protein YdjM n=1 Tax=Tissierella creatinophila DSM 6911 TaxID=1123403 RepID=A0A1U7M920_TISCR|nr:metal-dependent hydrolase [Tissierella creatinophila]OLS03797.1 inner membrane protein YdjM [Tissierella creatinophila DSM 6911]
MTGKTHIAIGVAAGLTMAYDKPINEQLIIIIASSLGSLIPDLDHPKSKLNQKLLFLKNELYRVVFFISIASIFLYLYMDKKNTTYALLSLIFLFIGISTHRGFTHSIMGFLIFAYIIKTITTQYNLDYLYQSISLGYLLHLVADFLTPKGVKLFYPLNVNIASPIIINPKSGIDSVIFTLASIYSIILLFKFIM